MFQNINLKSPSARKVALVVLFIVAAALIFAWSSGGKVRVRLHRSRTDTPVPLCYFTTPIFDPKDEKYGVNTASLDRWTEAKKNEFGLWDFYSNKENPDDRAEQHSTAFDNYASLPSDLGITAEYGCGPYTQLFYILRKRPDISVERIYLADPMINLYLTLSNCRYKNLTLDDRPVNLLVAPAENVAFPLAFDTIVMINVLEHVYDAELILRNLYNSLRPGGIVIFHDRTWDNKPRDENFIDKWHHIRIFHSALKVFVELFEPLYLRDDKDPTHDWSSEFGQANSFYFIGRKPMNCMHNAAAWAN